MNTTFKVQFHFTNIPAWMQVFVREGFVKCRSEVADVFNSKISEINDMWDRTGKPTMLDSDSHYVEDINPEYYEFIRSHLKPDIEQINRKHFVHCALDEYCDIIGTVPFIEGSKIWATLIPWGES